MENKFTEKDKEEIRRIARREIFRFLEAMNAGYNVIIDKIEKETKK